MMMVPGGVKVNLALGYTDMMGWTPPLAQRETEGLASQGEENGHCCCWDRYRQAGVPVARR